MFFLPIIIFSIFFVVFLIIGLSITKIHKHTTDTMTNMINTVSAGMKTEIEDVIEKPKNETKICEYCGSEISSSATQCNSCGAKIKK